jgi:hypothetical protein
VFDLPLLEPDELVVLPEESVIVQEPLELLKLDDPPPLDACEASATLLAWSALHVAVSPALYATHHAALFAAI